MPIPNETNKTQDYMVNKYCTRVNAVFPSLLSHPPNFERQEVVQVRYASIG